MKNFCIIGLGRFGMTLAVTLTEAGKHVMIIDTNEKTVETMADIVDAAILGDGTEEAVLRAADVKSYDCVVVSMSENINDSVLAVILLKELGVPYIIARAGSERHAKVLEKLGVDRIVFPEADIGVKMGRMLSYHGVQQYVEFSEDTTIVEIEVPKAWVGKNLLELDVRKRLNINVVTMRRKNSPKKGITADPKAEFKAGDFVTIIGENTAIQKLLGRQ